LNAIGNQVAMQAAGHSRPPAAEDLAARTAALCAVADAAVADPPPPDAILWLAEQLAEVGALLGRACRAGGIAAAAYEAGRLDERAHPAA